MRTALDTNILSALWSNEPTAPNLWQRLDAATQEGQIIISPIVYAEALAYPTITVDLFRVFLTDRRIQLNLELLDEVWTMAGLRYRAYAARRRQSSGEQPRRMLADFLIGAHAVHHADRLMTLDTARYKRDFPELRLYSL